MYGAHFHSMGYNDKFLTGANEVDEFLTGANEVMLRIDMETLAQLPHQEGAIASFQGCYKLDPIGCESCVPGLYSSS